MSEALARLRAEMPDAVVDTHAQHGDETLVLRPAEAREALAFLREDAASDFDMLIDLTAVDHAGRRDGERLPRFEVVYHLYSLGHNHRLRVKLGVEEAEPEVDSVVSLWAAADWMEREVFDLYGIAFRGHPDLRRILLYDEFEGHPLRKDYPKTRRQPLVGPRDA